MPLARRERSVDPVIRPKGLTTLSAPPAAMGSGGVLLPLRFDRS